MRNEYLCAKPTCRMVQRDLKFTDLVDEPLKVDDIILCGSCGNVSKVTLLGTALLTDEEFRALSEEEARDLNFAQRAIKQHLRNQ